MASRAGGRPKKDAGLAAPNAVNDGNYLRNLSSILLERDVGPTEFAAWLPCEKRTQAPTAPVASKTGSRSQRHQ